MSSAHAALQQCCHKGRIHVGNRVLFTCGNGQGVEPKGVPGQKLGIEGRGSEAQAVEHIAPAAPQRADADRPCQLTCSIAASWAAWFSVMRASINSSSASPAITLSSL